MKYEVTFGKYKGQTLEEIADKDINYVQWFAENYQQGTFVGYRGKRYPCKPNEEQKAMIVEAKRIAAIGKEIQDAEKAKRKEQYIKEAQDLGEYSEFIGTIGERQEFEVEFIKKQHFAAYEYDIFTFRDTDKNIITMYSLGKVSSELKKDTLYRIKGTPKKHKEYNGVKSTHINRATYVETLNLLDYSKV